MRGALALPVIMAVMSACSGPAGPIAGGKLDGTIAEWPADWVFLDEIENVLLETNPNDPYSVTVWGVRDAQHMYVGASSERNTWAQNIARDSRVVLGIDNKLYPAHARIVTDLAIIDRVMKQYFTKYEMDNSFVEDDGVLYRLEPRQ